MILGNGGYKQQNLEPLGPQDSPFLIIMLFLETRDLWCPLNLGSLPVFTPQTTIPVMAAFPVRYTGINWCNMMKQISFSKQDIWKTGVSDLYKLSCMFEEFRSR